MIIPAIKEALQGRYPPDSLMSESCKRQEAVQNIINKVAEGIHWVRRAEPPPEKGYMAIVLSTLSLTPEYLVSRESELVQPIVQLDVYGQGIPPKWVFDLSTDCRLALSNYRGELWDPEQNKIYIHGATVVREQPDVANISVTGGGYWSFVSGFDIQISYNRAALAQGE